MNHAITGPAGRIFLPTGEVRVPRDGEWFLPMMHHGLTAVQFGPGKTTQGSPRVILREIHRAGHKATSIIVDDPVFAAILAHKEPPTA